MKMNLEPPSFISANKSYAQYEKDLKQWLRLTSLDKKLQAELVVYKLGEPNHESKIKEQITTQIGDQLEGKEDGIERDRIPYLSRSKNLTSDGKHKRLGGHVQKCNT